jgi:hypothetical protein
MKTKKQPTPATLTDQRPVCTQCGGRNVEATRWIEYRPDGTAAVVNGEGPDDQFGNWCHDCDEHTELDYPETTPADDARRQAAAAAREAGPELLAALAKLLRVAEQMNGGDIFARAVMIHAEHLVNRCRHK